MSSTADSVLTINGGSSSIKFALYQTGPPMQRSLTGIVDHIGSSGTHLTYSDASRDPQESHNIDAAGHALVVDFLLDWLERQVGFKHVSGVGHRVGHGMKHSQPERVSQALLDELHRIRSYDPDHLPREIELIEAFRRRYPNLPQVACFDTAFHHSLPRVARLLPIPRRFDAAEIQRYGFHGLSYAYLMQELAQLAGTQAGPGPGDPAAPG
ncbi:hypothetical protein [Thiobacillus denitrificans]|uniref:hypothetical protein n=1 Tax=Thiobacillus denitrificans TaxID=36861 RepID=UPI000A8DEED3|nr:hypothetical protein [Thiobacillus denitrificans]